MDVSAVWFWMRLSNSAGAGGAATAQVERSEKKTVFEDIAPNLIIEGTTIRVRAKVAMDQTVAVFSILGLDGQANTAGPVSFYPDSTLPNKASRRFRSFEEAAAEPQKEEFKKWAKDGVVTIVCLGIARV
jgi:hypothetical protein